MMTTQGPDNADEFQLSPRDIDALDRFIDARSQSRTIAEGSEEARVLSLLGLLETPVAGETERGSRVDLTALRAQRSQTIELSQIDQDAIDQWIEGGCDIDALDDALQPRGAALHAMHTLAISGVESNPRDKTDLVNRTLARIQDHIDIEQSSYEIPRAGKGTMRFRLADLISVAAMLLIAGSIAMPIFNQVNERSEQVACLGNLGTVADAFGIYANSNRDALPMATAGFGPTWMNVGSTPDQSNSANLYTLIRTDHTSLADLACPSNPNAPTQDAVPGAWDWQSIEEISYSYRIMPKGGLKMHSAMPVRVVLMSDRSPVTLRAIRGVPVVPEENSPNHGFIGQHILKLDGSTQWLSRPVIEDSDNLWLPRLIEQALHQFREHHGIIEGNEQPDGPTDAFVGP